MTRSRLIHLDIYHVVHRNIEIHRINLNNAALYFIYLESLSQKISQFVTSEIHYASVDPKLGGLSFRHNPPLAFPQGILSSHDL